MKINYRPHIDGLRGIAIILIILSHFKELSFVSGGVNIFFVISGYLISHIVVKSDFKIIKFYNSRFLKLYPQIFLVATLTLIFFILFGNFDKWLIIIRSYGYTIFGLMNIFLIKIGNVYSLQNFINPFLPFWAFGVIIQFYLIYPIFLKTIFILKKKFNFNSSFIILTILVTSVLFFLLFYVFKDKVIFNFYSPLSRYWQFFLGGFLFFLVKYKKDKYFKNISSYIGLFLLVIWQLDFNIFHNYRNASFLITIASILILYSSNKNIINEFLSFKILRNIGKISYPLYLVHMPVIYFISIYLESYLVVYISIILTFLFTYFLTNFQNSNFFNLILLNIFKKNKFMHACVIIFFIISIGTYFINKNLFFSIEKKIKNTFLHVNYINSKSILFKKVYSDSYKKSQHWVLGKNNKSCHDQKENAFKNCIFLEKSNVNKSIYLIGGSQVSTLSFDLKKKLINQDFNYYHLTKRAYIYLPNFDFKNVDNGEIDKSYIKFSKKIRNKILSNNKNIAIIGARYPLMLSGYYFDNQEGGVEGKKFNSTYVNNDNIKIAEGFKESIEELSKNGINVILIYPIPEAGWNIPSKVLNKFFIKKNKINNKNYVTTSYLVYKNRNKSSFELLDSIEGKNIHRIYPNEIFCDSLIKKRCITHNDKDIFYSDHHHLSYKGSIMINDLIMEKLKKILD